MSSEDRSQEEFPFNELRNMVGKDRPPGDELEDGHPEGGEPEHEEIITSQEGPGDDDDLGMPGEVGDEAIPENEREPEPVADEVDEDELPDDVDESVPPYLREEEPAKKGDNIKWHLLRGASKEELIAAGAAPRSVDIARGELVKANLMVKKEKPPPPPRTGVAVAGEPKPIQVFSKGSPPEAIINALVMPEEAGVQGPAFEQGLKFGMSVLVLGVRVMQEMSQVGLQQSKPIIDMAKEMRTGEAAAYKEASTDAAMKTAQAMGQTMGPMLASIESAVDKLERPAEGTDPMKSMMIRTMEPLMKRMMNQIAPGMENEPISNWKRTQE